MGAAYLRVPEIALEREEAKALAQAIAEVSKHYKIPGVSPEHASIASLVFVIFVTYGKRVPAILARRSGVAPAPAPAAPFVTPSSDGSPPVSPVPADPWFTPTAPIQ